MTGHVSRNSIRSTAMTTEPPAQQTCRRPAVHSMDFSIHVCQNILHPNPGFGHLIAVQNYYYFHHHIVCTPAFLEMDEDIQF